MQNALAAILAFRQLVLGELRKPFCYGSCKGKNHRKWKHFPKQIIPNPHKILNP